MIVSALRSRERAAACSILCSRPLRQGFMKRLTPVCSHLSHINSDYFPSLFLNFKSYTLNRSPVSARRTGRSPQRAPRTQEFKVAAARCGLGVTQASNCRADRGRVLWTGM